MAASALEGIAQGDTVIHRDSAQTFVAYPSERQGFLDVNRRHAQGNLEQPPSFTVGLNEAKDTLLVFTRSFRDEPRFHVKRGDKGDVEVYTLDRGMPRKEPGWIVIAEDDGVTYSAIRIQLGQRARFRSALATVDRDKGESLLFSTGTGDEPLQRPFRIVDHAQVRKSDVEIGDLKPEIVVTIVAMIDMMRATR